MVERREHMRHGKSPDVPQWLKTGLAFLRELAALTAAILFGLLFFLLMTTLF